MSWGYPWGLVCCPCCRGRVISGAAGISCEGCTYRSNKVGDIPCLVTDPDGFAEQWGRRSAAYLEQVDAMRDGLIAEVAAAHTTDRVRQRLRTLHHALGLQRDRIFAVLAEAGLGPRGGEPMHASVTGEGHVLAHYAQLQRDWAWDAEGSHENRRALAEIEGILAGTDDIGQLLVFGAGGCRLATDVHRRFNATRTLALDLNPLPLLVAARVLAGTSVKLIETPTVAKDGLRPWAERSLACHEALPREFYMAFADALDPPVVSGTFDTLLTPWFIDQVPRDVGDLFPVVRKVLKPQGRWINHGPLIYQHAHTRAGHRYTIDELLELIENSGMHIESYRTSRMTYMQSPLGTQGRTEVVLTFVARCSAIASEAEIDVEPPWLRDAGIPVDRFGGLDGYEAPHPMFALVAGLIDGRRTSTDIAQIMVRRHGIPEGVAVDGVMMSIREIWRCLRPPVAKSGA